MILASDNTLPPEGAPVPGIYQHYRGQRYQVLGLARHSETDQWLVIYQALYGEHGFWVRPLSLWLEPVVVDRQGIVEIPDARAESGNAAIVRFELLEENTQSLASVTTTVR